MKLVPYMSGCLIKPRPPSRNEHNRVENKKTIKVICFGPKFSGKTLFVNKLQDVKNCIDKYEFSSIMNYHTIIPKSHYVCLDLTETVGNPIYSSVYKSLLKNLNDIALIFFQFDNTNIEMLDFYIDLADHTATQYKIVVINKKGKKVGSSLAEMYCLQKNILNICIDVSSGDDIYVLVDMIYSLMHTKAEYEMLKRPLEKPQIRSREKCDYNGLFLMFEGVYLGVNSTINKEKNT